MTKAKSTKRALLMSALAVLACVSMLIGSTFAWFTDSVTSAGNKIVAGTLDVQLLMNTGDGYVDISDSTAPIFGEGALAQNNNAETLWEPGKTQVAYLAIKNNGSLALKYKVALDVVNVAKDLYEVMEYAILPDAEYGEVTSWMSGNSVVTGLQAVSGNVSLAVGATHYFALAVHMDEEAGNEYQGGQVNFDLSVIATQDTVEYDSFDNQYDDVAFVSDAAALADAIANGENVMLTNDIAVDANATITAPADADLILDLNGHTISGTATTSGGNRSLFTVKGNMSVIGNGTVSMKYTGTNMEWNNLSAAFSVEGGELSLGEGVNVVNLGGTDMAYAVDVNTTLGETVLNVDGAVLYSSYIGVRIFNNHATQKGIVNYNSGIIQGATKEYDIWAQLMGSPAENAVVNIADGITYTTAALSGTMYYIDADTTLVANADTMLDALKNGEDVILANDVTLTGKVITTNGVTEAYGNKVGVAQYGGTLDGNGNTLTETGTSAYVIVTHGGTIKNLTIVGGGRGIVIYAPTEDVIIDNVVIDGPGYAINTAEHNGQDLIVTNSTVNGWTSLAGLDSVSFTNCKLGENSTKCWQNYGYDADYDRLIRPYGTATFTDCTFEKNFYIDLSALDNGNTVTLTNCNCEGVVLTAENYVNYITVELPNWATGIADCIVFN